jgi:hypothetical protein
VGLDSGVLSVLFFAMAVVPFLGLWPLGLVTRKATLPFLYVHTPFGYTSPRVR